MLTMFTEGNKSREKWSHLLLTSNISIGFTFLNRRFPPVIKEIYFSQITSIKTDLIIPSNYDQVFCQMTMRHINLTFDHYIKMSSSNHTWQLKMVHMVSHATAYHYCTFSKELNQSQKYLNAFSCHYQYLTMWIISCFYLGFSFFSSFCLTSGECRWMEFCMRSPHNPKILHLKKEIPATSVLWMIYGPHCEQSSPPHPPLPHTHTHTHTAVDAFWLVTIDFKLLCILPSGFIGVSQAKSSQFYLYGWTSQICLRDLYGPDSIGHLCHSSTEQNKPL